MCICCGKEKGGEMSKASNIQKMIDYLKVKECVTRDELATLLNVKKSTISNYVGDINADHHYLIEASTGRYGDTD